MLNNLLLLRLAVFNTCGVFLLIWAWTLGYIQRVFEGDVSHISYIIVALFVVGLISTFWRATKTSAGLNALKVHAPLHSRNRARHAAKKMAVKNAHLGDVLEALVLLGLIGNVVGFLIAMSGADLASLNTPEGAQALAAQLLAGLGVAFYTTLAGTVLALWTMVNVRMLETATALYVEDLG